MLYSCPNHELQREIIMQSFYARLSENNRNMLDTSCAGSSMMKTIEFTWNLLDRIKGSSEDWDLDEGKESGITPKFDCVKSFMDTDAFRGFSSKYGLDSEIVATFVNLFLLTLISLKRSGLNITHLLKKKSKNRYQLKKKL